MPNRIIKESIHDSEDVNKMTDFQFRLWVNLIAYVDDYGRGDARPAIIKGKCFPLRDKLSASEINAGLKALSDIGCIVLYEAEGKPYLYFPTWERHQRIQQKKSKYPSPPCFTVSHREPPPESNPIQSNTIKSEIESESESKKKDVFSDFCGQDDCLLQALRDFEKMRKQIKKPLTDRAKTLLLSKLQTFPRREWVDIINQSIMNGWQGIFPLKDVKRETNNIFLQIAEEENG